MSARVIARRPSDYRTSFPIEDIELESPGRGRSRIVCKRLDREALDATARLAKPLFLHAEEREPFVYETLLPHGPDGPPAFLGAEREGGDARLYIEWIDGRPLSEVGEVEAWEGVASWLGRFHATFERLLDDLPLGSPLVDRDADFHRLWFGRAREFGAAPDEVLDWLEPRHRRSVEALAAMDRTVLHGEFYPSNVLLSEAGGSTRVAPVDWELCGPGPGALDLGALVCGWPRPERESMRRAYGSALGRELPARSLDLARFQVAIQWLGWAPPEWKPPTAQRRDWAAEAIEIAEELEL
ncbi:MAG: aminoglycoside phosphotransferase family protein [Actinobacteria bacterium]|nr:aminoglycoside phosphotransferase family protein [Actinomycetota bacterium]